MEDSNAQRESQAASHNGGDSPRMATTEGQQSSQDSSKSREGIQQGGRSQAQEVAVAYHCGLDAWVQVPTRAIRNPDSPMLVWMKEETWRRLACCASSSGQFYLPCEQGLTHPQHLRMLVNQEEVADGS